MNKFHNDPLYDFLFDKEFKFWERSVWEEQAPLFSFGDDVNVIPPEVKQERRSRMVEKEKFKNVPEYYPWMYLDGYSPEEILYSAR